VTLQAGRRPLVRAVSTLLAGGGAWLITAGAAAAASPTPTQALSADTRSALEGPGFVGSPGIAILAVIAIALAAVIATTVYVRLSRPDQPKDG
jgi:hypothetical protein